MSEHLTTCTSVSIDKLIIDPRYQRPIEEKRVARMVEGFNPKLLGALEVSARENGTFAVIDGQHRLAALKAIGRKRVAAIKHDGLDARQEAELFTRLNMGRKQLTPVQRFRGQVFAGDLRAMEIQNIITECGFCVSDDNQRVGNIKAIASIERSYKAYGAENLRKGLALIRDTWQSEKMSTNGHLLGGVALFMHDFGDRFDERHAVRLESVSALSVVRRAQEIIVANGSSTGPKAVCEVLRKHCGLRGMSGRKDQPVLSKAKRDDLATA